MIKRILVVDDDQQICEGLRLNLSDLGYEVHTANDWYMAGKMSRLNEYDLIISDNILDAVYYHRGIFVIPRIVADQERKGNRTRSILMSQDSVLDHPADIFLQKPFNIEVLSQAIASLS